MDDKKLLEMLRQSASDLTPPDSLGPDAIEALLAQSQPAPRRKRFLPLRFAATAAVLALTAVSAWQITKIQRQDPGPGQALTQTADRDEAASADALPPDGAAGTSGPAAAQEGSGKTAGDIPALAPAASYEEIYDTLYQNFYVTSDSAAMGTGAYIGEEEAVAYDYDRGADGMEIAADASAVSAAADAGAVSEDGAAAEARTESYSSTNVQERGVDEADIVKTDGQYLYILRQDGAVCIVRADPQAPEPAATIAPASSSQANAQELYVDKDTLSVITTEQSSSLTQDGDVYYPSYRCQTVLYTYDISDRAAPKLAGTVVQDGTYESSRKNGTYIYLFTSYQPDIRATYEESRFIPNVNGQSLETSDFYLPGRLTDPAYLLISSTDIRMPGQTVDQKALVSGASHYYVSTENIYIANLCWDSGTEQTEITKFHYEDGAISGIAAGLVKGYLNDSFSLNEYNGYLRAVSTYYDDDYEEHNGLYVLDGSLAVIGSIEDLAEGETVRSARFFGDTGYFVTFRQTDPLFSVDLSDPASPNILGQLKVSGFSSYLHFYGEDLLLGMGYEADETTGSVSGLKLSMFDISDPSDVVELHRLVIPGVTWCPSLLNYKSILIDPEKNLFGFFCGDRYLVFSYDRQQGFTSELIYDFLQDALAQQTRANGDGTDVSPMDAGNTRGLYIGDTFYLAGDASVVTFDMQEGYRKITAMYLPGGE